MQKVYLESIAHYGWECPDCGEYNYQENLSTPVSCDSCDKEFEATW